MLQTYVHILQVFPEETWLLANLALQAPQRKQGSKSGQGHAKPRAQGFPRSLS